MSNKKPTDASDEEAVERAEEKALLKQQLRDEALKELLGTKKGRNYYWHLMAMAGVFETSFSTNALTMAKNEGERTIGLRLLTDLMRVCPEMYAVMAKEENDNG